MREVTPSSESIRNRSHFTYAAIGLAILVVCVFGVFLSKRTEDAATKDFSGYSMSSLLGEAESGNLAAQVRVSEHYRDGTGGFAKSDANHFEWALRAANAGNIRAKVYVGRCYYHGTGTKADYRLAQEMFSGPATDFDDPLAQAYMGFLSAGLEGLPPKDDFAVSVQWFKKSAEGGEPLGQFGYGQSLLLGIGTTVDAKEGVRLLKSSLERGCLHAAGPLGWAYAEGLGVERDYKEAARLYEIGANQEGDESAYRLALLYLSGRGVIKDVEEALKWFKRASEGGNIDAKKSIANLYDTGGEVGYDAAMASKLYLEVALTGDVWSQRLLGFRYRNGNGLSVDAVESYAWFNVCASSGDSVAAMERDEAAKTLSRAQILAAQKRSREILKEIEAKKAKK